MEFRTTSRERAAVARRYGEPGIEPSPSRPPRLVTPVSSFDDYLAVHSTHWKCNIKNLRMYCDFKVSQLR